MCSSKGRSTLTALLESPYPFLSFLGCVSLGSKTLFLSHLTTIAEFSRDEKMGWLCAYAIVELGAWKIHHNEKVKENQYYQYMAGLTQNLG